MRILNFALIGVMKKLYFGLVIGMVLFVISNCTTPDSVEFRLEIEPVHFTSQELPVHVGVQLPSNLNKIPVEQLAVTLRSDDNKFKNLPGQIIETESGQYELWWILPVINENVPNHWTAKITHAEVGSIPTFKWEDTPNKYLDLNFNGRRAFRYVYEMENHFEKGKTYSALNKPFFHIYDSQGEYFITNDGSEKTKYPHHKGIMIGWRSLGFQGDKISFWGMEDLNVQKHIKFKKNIAGPVLAQTEALIHWNDSSGVTIIEELRKATIYKQPSPDLLLLDFSSKYNAFTEPLKIHVLSP